MSKIDILMPVYNGAATLRQAVASLQAQTFADFRLIAVDDGSTDRSLAILRALANDDARITVLSDENSGIVNALQRGLAICTAEFIARQDADDVSCPDRLQAELSYMLEHSDCVAVSGSIKHIDEKGKLTGHSTTFSPQDADPKTLPARDPHLSHPFLMARRSTLECVGGYRYVYHAEDVDLYWRLQEHGYLHSLEQQVGFYRMHSASISSRSVLDGRIMALSFQLSALSAIRRQRGENDIHFSRGALASYRAARSLEKLVELGSEQLSAQESAHLRVSTSVKLIELSTYRPYVIDRDDCRYIKAAINSNAVSITVSADVYHLIAKASARLIRRGHFREACALTPVRSVAPLALRLVFDCTPAVPKAYLRKFFFLFARLRQTAMSRIA